MKALKLLIIISIILILFQNYVYSQGCSDAGICTLNNLKPNVESKNNYFFNQLKLGLSFAKADYNISNVTTYLEYNRIVNNSLGIDIKLTSINQFGNKISVAGLSDLFISANYKIEDKIKLILGTKLPLSDGNQTKNNISLPMDYQTSLGTWDIFLGFALQLNNFQLSLAFQNPLSQNNNKFIPSNYSLDSKIREIHSTNLFKRKSDLIFRASYPIEINNEIKFTPSILPIYHISNDKFSDSLGIENEILNSKGLTFNISAFIDYEISNSKIIQLNIGMPILTRKVRPDGLTRSFVLNLEFKTNF